MDDFATGCDILPKSSESQMNPKGIARHVSSSLLEFLATPLMGSRVKPGSLPLHGFLVLLDLSLQYNRM